MAKKRFVLIIFLVLCVNIFAFEYLGSDNVDDLNKHESYYEFFSADLDNPADILSIGMLLAREGKINLESGINFVWGVTATVSIRPIRVIKNNTSLRQAVKDKMRQKGANVSLTVDGNSYLYVNILMINGTYTTIVYY